MAKDMMAIRIDDSKRARIDRAASRRGQSSSEAVRQAIDVWLEDAEAEESPYDRIADLIGTFEGPGDLPTGGGARVAEQLKARHAKPRS